MNAGKMATWLQIAANVGILGGLILVGLQINQNSELIRLQIIYDDSRRLSDMELMYVGERGADAWAKAIDDPGSLDRAEQKVVESFLYSTFEMWRSMYYLHRQGLIGDEWAYRIKTEVPYYYGHTYGRAWWRTYKAYATGGEDEQPTELVKAIDIALANSGSFHKTYHDGIMRLVDDLTGEANTDTN